MKTTRFFILVMALMTSVMVSATIPKKGISVSDPRCENMINPLGVNTLTPRLSWKNTSMRQGQQQTAYEIEAASTIQLLENGQADIWKSGKVTSGESVLVKWQGPSLKARQMVWWRVRTFDRKGRPSAWSEIARFSIGVTGDTTLQGDYIRHKGKNKDRQAFIFRTKVQAQGGKTMLAHVNSLGYHELYINGKKADNNVLQPAVVEYRKRSLINTYDITPLLREDENDIAVWCGMGWYKQTFVETAVEGPVVKMEIDEQQGQQMVPVAATNTSWQVTPSGYYDLGEWRYGRYVGEKIDHRATPHSMTSAGLDQLAWKAPETVAVGNIEATPQMFPGNIVIDTLPAVSIKQTGDKEWLVDVGRCITGWCKVTFEGLQPGQEVRLDYSDYMEDEKSFKKDHDHDILVAAGNGEETFCNKFNHHAFRYICISGAEKIKNIEALQISGNYREASTFACSDEGLNAVHDLIHYTIRCLSFSGYMVDCPHIERQGYGGDGNSSTMTFQTMYDVAPTYYNWLQAWHDVIEPDGSVPHVAPMYNCGGGPYWCSFVVKAPWRSYLNYGDEQFLARQYDDMKLWMTYVDRYSREGLLHRWPDTNTRSWFLGDWIAPQDIDVKDSASVLLISNCCVSDALASMSHTARVLGKPDEAQHFDQKRLRLNERIHAEFYHPEDSTYGTGVPTDMAYAMISGVVPTNLYEGVKEKLEKLSRGKYNSHIAVGLTGVPVFTSWAVLNDEVDLMTDILRQRDCPGYLYMIEKGGTATWEYWHGLRSYIHNCFNGIGTWFYQALAGIRPDADAPGYRHFTIRPQYAQLIDHVRATKECPYGEIAVEWTKSGNDKELRIAVPIGTTATLTLPEGTQKYQINGKKKKAKSDTLLLESGRYTIICHN